MGGTLAAGLASLAGSIDGGEADTAVGWDRVQVGHQPGGGEALEEPIEQAKVHSAHKFGVFLRQGTERAVGERDLITFPARFETVFLEYL